MKIGKPFSRRDPRLDIPTPVCPLCHAAMVRKFDPTRGFYIFACDTPKTCSIAIRVSDPFVGRWELALDKSSEGKGIPCPRPACEKPMRYFATQSGFMKAVCVCGASITNAMKDRTKDTPMTTPENPGVIQ